MAGDYGTAVEEAPAETKAADGKRSKEELAGLAKSLTKKLRLSAQERAKKASDAAEYKLFEFGFGPGQVWEQLAKAIEAGDWDQTTIPLHGVFRQTIIPALFADDPRWTGGAQDQDEVSRGFARICQELCMKIQKVSDIRGESVAAFSDSLPWGDGYACVDYSEERKLARIRWKPSKRVLVDCETDGNARTHHRQWVAEEKRMPLSEAQRQWPNHEFNPSKEKSPTVEGEPVEMVDVVCVYLSGDNPWTSSGANQGAAPDAVIEPRKQDVSDEALAAKKDTPYDGKQLYVVLEVRGDLNNEKTECHTVEVLDQWPGVTDYDSFLLRNLRLVPDDTKNYGTSIYQSSHASVVMASWAMTWYNTHIHNAASQAILYVGDRFDSVNIPKLFNSRKNLRLVKVDSAEAMPDRGGIFVMDLCKPSPEIPKAFTQNAANAEKLNNIDQIRMEARSHTSATSDAIRNEYAQLYLGWLRRAVHDFVGRLMRDAIMTCRYYMTAEDVALWVGDDLMGWETKDDPDNPGTKIKISKYWKDADRDIAKIRREVDVSIVPNSMAFKPPEQEIQGVRALFDMQMMLVDKLVAQGMMVPPEVYMGPANNLFERIATVLDVPNPGDMKFDWSQIKPPPPPPEEAPQEPEIQLGKSGGKKRRIERHADGTEIEEVNETGPDVPAKILAMRAAQEDQHNLGPRP